LALFAGLGLILLVEVTLFVITMDGVNDSSLHYTNVKKYRFKPCQRCLTNHDERLLTNRLARVVHEVAQILTASKIENISEE
jgi:hypothetical protein